MTRADRERTPDFAAVRHEFPILQRPLADGTPLVYLDSAATAQKPRAVIDKLVECCERCYANPHRGIHRLGDQVTTQVEQARDAVRAFLGAAESEEIVFTSGTTMSVNLVAHAWGRKFLQPGDEILLNVMEHHANLVPWQEAARARGAKLRFLPLTPEGQLELSRLGEFVSRRTRLIAVTAMSNVLGTINPLEPLSEAARAVGAVLFVDAAQSVAHRPTHVREPRVDFLAFSGHKVYGPSGVGVLYARRELLEAMDPFLTGGHMIYEVQPERSTWADPPSKFEAGTLPIIEIIALRAAIEFVQSLGFSAIAAHEQALTAYACERLSSVRGLRIYGPRPPERGAIVSFSIDGIHAHDLADLVDRKGVAVRAGHHCTMPLHDWLDVPATTRASFAVYNTREEIDALIDALEFARRTFRLR